MLPLSVGVAVNILGRAKRSVRDFVASYAAAAIAGIATCYMLWPFPSSVAELPRVSDGFGYIAVMLFAAVLMVVGNLATKFCLSRIKPQIQLDPQQPLGHRPYLYYAPLMLLISAGMEIAVHILAEYYSCRAAG